jgi:FlaG/FlaF family flagellin (archaellin)
MLKTRKLNRRGISPVIATIIIVAVSIAIAIAVAFWVVGIAGLFTRFEKLEISYIYAEKTEEGGWKIALMVKNTGSATATIDRVFLNGKPSPEAESVLTTSLSPGSTLETSFQISSGFNPGMTVEVKLHTASGQEYYKAVVLP